MCEVVSGRHVLKTLVSKVEEQVAGGAGEAHDPLIGLISTVTIRAGRGSLVIQQ